MRKGIATTILMFVISVLYSTTLLSQDKSNKGKEFWLGYGYSWVFDAEGPPFNTQELVLYLSADAPANVTVSVTNTSWSQTVAIPANTVDATIKVPKTGTGDARIFIEGLHNKAVHIVSDTPIVVYAHTYNTMVSAATMLMPVETYGYKYFSLNYSQSQSASSPPHPPVGTTQNGPAWYSYFYVVASEDNTRLEITPSDTTRNGWLPGNTYTVNLNKGEIYNVMGKLSAGSQAWQASKDLTGSKVIAIPGADGNCHPFAFFSGSSGIRLCKSDGGEVMQQQVFPIQAWGTRYLTYHTLNNTTTDINAPFKNFYRIAVEDPATIVRRNGVPMTGLINNFYYEVIDSTGGDYYESDKPFLLSQYTPNYNSCWRPPPSIGGTYGDPEMFYLSPIEQGKKDVLFYANRNASIDYNYLNVIVPTAGLGSLQLDGAPFVPANTRPHPNHPGYSVAVSRIPGAAAQHRLTCDSTFNATVYGLGYYESYGYNVGTNINNLNSYTRINNVFNSTGGIDTFTCPKTPFRLYAKLAYPANSITWKLSLVPGLSPNTDSVITSPVPVGTETINGRTYYVYTLQQDFTFTTPGTYKIPITYTTSVIANCNQTERAELTVVVKPGPTGDFIFTTPICLSDSVYFNGSAGANGYTLTSFLWNFPDNTTANIINPVKKFITAGANSVRFRVIASNGCLADTTKQVNVNDSPVARLGASSPICAKDSVYITDTSSISTGTISNWRYDFGDGNILTRTTNTPFYHPYNTPGTYIIKLVTNSNLSCKSDTSYKTVIVNPLPLAKFGYSGNICVSDSVRFTDTSSVSPGTITQWEWNFGDGNSQTMANGNPFYHPYTTTGNFTVTLVTVSSNGCKSDTTKKVVSVSNRPSATFTSTGIPCVDSTRQFTSSFTAGATPATWYWSFGDGQTASSTTSNTVSHSYLLPQTNVVIKHVVNLGAACVSDTATFIIPAIHPNPVASFTITGDTLCTNKPVMFSSGLSGINIWNWQLGDGPSGQQPPFSHIYKTPGTFNISLIVKDINGCGSNQATDQLVINPSPTVSAGPDKFISVGSSTTLDASIANASNYTFLWSPPLYLSDVNILTPTSTPDYAPMTYTITATDKSTFCSAKDDVIITPVSKIYIPTGFTPNNDGKNDKWVIPGLALYPNAVVSVYNRWGEKIFESKNYINNPWTGFYKTLLQPAGAYVYTIQLNDDKKQFYKGTVTLIW